MKLSSKHSYSIAITVIHFLAGLFILQHHELWRDEVQMWLICEDSASILELLTNKDPDHPILWYLTLYAIQKTVNDIFFVQLFNLLCISSCVYLINQYAPFSKLQKILLSFGYYFFYEYNIIARNYSPTLLMFFVVLVLMNKPNRSMMKIAIALSIMANYHIMGGILSVSLAIYIYLKDLEGGIRKNFFPVFVYSFSLFASVFESLRRTIGWGYFEPHTTNGLEFFLDDKWVFNSLTTFLNGFITLPDFTNPNLWNSSFLYMFPYRAKIGIVLTLALIASIFYLIRKDRKLLLSYAMLSILMFVLFSFVKLGQLRNHGYFFIGFIMIVWLGGNSRSSILNKMFTGVLILQLVSGITLSYLEINKPFSGSELMANNHWVNSTNNIVIGSTDYTMTPITYHAKRKIFYTESDQFGSYMKWGERKHLLKEDELINLSKSIRDTTKSNVILILDNHHFKERIKKEGVKLIFEVKNALVADENYRAYLINKNERE